MGKRLIPMAIASTRKFHTQAQPARFLNYVEGMIAVAMAIATFCAVLESEIDHRSFSEDAVRPLCKHRFLPMKSNTFIWIR